MDSVKFSTITADNVSQWLNPVEDQTAYNRFLKMLQAFSTDGFLPQTDRDAFQQKIHGKMQPPVDIIFDVPLSARLVLWTKVQKLRLLQALMSQHRLIPWLNGLIHCRPL